MSQVLEEPTIERNNKQPVSSLVRVSALSLDPLLSGNLPEPQRDHTDCGVVSKLLRSRSVCNLTVMLLPTVTWTRSSLRKF